MSYQAIQSLLVERLKTVDGLPTLQEENTKNVARTGVPFSRATLIQSRATPATIGASGRDERSGLLQVDLFVPQDTGVSAVNALADAVVAHFPRGLSLTQDDTSVQVVLAWRETGTRHKEPFYGVPVIVQWRTIV